MQDYGVADVERLLGLSRATIRALVQAGFVKKINPHSNATMLLILGMVLGFFGSTILSISITFEKATYEGGTKALQMAVEKVRIMNY